MGLAGLIQNRRKRKAIGQYLARLAPVLARHHGRAECYTPGQVREALEEARLSPEWECYAFCIYCELTAFKTQCRTERYWELRVEVAESHFHGNATFTVSQVRDRFARTSGGGGWYGSIGDSGDGGGVGHDGGGHHGGH